MASKRFPAAEFDEWAATYDKTVGSGTGFPFEGYARVLSEIFTRSGAGPGSAVLDVGVGTGNLALLFAAQGCDLWGLDFSGEMLARARTKLPSARLVQADLQGAWPPELDRRFDCIVSAYVFHHFSLAEKIGLITPLIRQHLNPGGRLLIGDIAFPDQAGEKALAGSLGDEWEQEEYWIVDQSLAGLAKAGLPAEFVRVSFCAGVFIFAA